jgi:hypothetical protein
MRIGLKIRCQQWRAGSSPAARTNHLVRLMSDEAGSGRSP